MDSESSKRKRELIQRTQNLAVEVIKLVRKFPKDAVAYVIGKQIIRSATSISANIVEAECAISRKEFIMFMNIAKRESKETFNWLEMIEKSGLAANEALESIKKECFEISKILTSIVKTSQSTQIINHNS